MGLLRPLFEFVLQVFFLDLLKLAKIRTVVMLGLIFPQDFDLMALSSQTNSSFYFHHMPPSFQVVLLLFESLFGVDDHQQTGHSFLRRGLPEVCVRALE